MSSTLPPQHSSPDPAAGEPEAAPLRLAEWTHAAQPALSARPRPPRKVSARAVVRVRVYHRKAGEGGQSTIKVQDIFLEGGMRVVDGNFVGHDGQLKHDNLIFMPENKLIFYF